MEPRKITSYVLEGLNVSSVIDVHDMADVCLINVYICIPIQFIHKVNTCNMFFPNNCSYQAFEVDAIVLGDSTAVKANMVTCTDISNAFDRAKNLINDCENMIAGKPDQKQQVFNEAYHALAAFNNGLAKIGTEEVRFLLRRMKAFM